MVARRLQNPFHPGGVVIAEGALLAQVAHHFAPIALPLAQSLLPVSLPFAGHLPHGSLPLYLSPLNSRSRLSGDGSCFSGGIATPASVGTPIVGKYRRA
jgi:hypothetical protein